MVNSKFRIYQIPSLPYSEFTKNFEFTYTRNERNKNSRFSQVDKWMTVNRENQFNTNMNDLNLRFERNPSSRHMTYLKVSGLFWTTTETYKS